jgi:hypothetical protein
VSTGGWIETVLRYGSEAVDAYIKEAKALGFDVIEISTGFISLPTDSLVGLVERVKKAGLKAKPEVGIQFGAGGSTSTAELEAEGTQDVGWLITRAERVLDAGADIVMIESEGITENVKTWRTDVVARIIDALGLDKVMFEGADPEVFVVRQEPRQRDQSVRRPQPDRAARGAAVGHLGDQGHMGADPKHRIVTVRSCRDIARPMPFPHFAQRLGKFT